jgi:predicted phosphodiesterase
LRALVVADIHANLEALRAVIEDAERRGGFDVIWCLGDTVGYGPDPVPCLDLLQQYNLVAVAGNHDHAAIGKRTIEDFNYAAAAAARWTESQLTTEASAFLASLPSVVTAGPFTLVHGTLRDPISEYLLNQDAARSTLELLRTPYCLVGHSHLPFLCLEEGGNPQFVEFPEDRPFELGEQRCIINPGCVGQPRDRDPRPSYALCNSHPSDTGGMTIARHRVAYNIKKTQQKMRQAGLPQVLIDRLDHGW